MRDCINVGLVTSFDWIMYGLKPNPKAVLKYFDVYGINPDKLLVCGDGFRDIRLGYLLKNALKSQKVRVDKVLVDRNNLFIAGADYVVRNLRDLLDLIESESCPVVLCDGDNTLWKFYADITKKGESESKMEKYGSHWTVRAGYFLFTGLDTVFSRFGIYHRRLFNGKNDDLSKFLHGIGESESLLIVNSLSSDFTVKRMLGKTGVKINYIRNRAL